MDSYGQLSQAWSQGYQGAELQHVDGDHVCYKCGNSIQLFNVRDSTQLAFPSPGRGVAQFAAVCTHKVFAVAEGGLNPRIFVCRFATLEPVSELTGGAELEYSKLAFSYKGSFLAAASGLPDFTMFVWDWMTGQLLCQEKLVNEEAVLSLMFNPLNQHQMSLMSATSVSVWSIEECNDTTTVRSRAVAIPTADGVVAPVDDDSMSRVATTVATTRVSFGSIPLPASTRAGLSGADTDKFTAPENRREYVRPRSQCWSTRSDVLVGCDGGQLFRVDGERAHAVLLLGSMSDRIVSGEVEPGMFESLALNAAGLLAGGRDGTLRLVHLDNNGIRVDKLWTGVSPIRTVAVKSSGQVEVAFGTAGGAIHRMQQGGAVEAALDAHVGRFVGVASAAGGKHLVTCREDGQVQIWNAENGVLIASHSLNFRVSAVAACPSAPVVAVGTCTGHVMFVHVVAPTDEEGERLEEGELEMRVVGCTRFHRSPVSCLQYDEYGRVLVSSCSDERHVFVVDARPSRNFAPIGSIDCGDGVRSFSLHQRTNRQTDVLVLVTSGDDTSAVVAFTLTSDVVDAPDAHYVTLRCDLKDESVNRVRYELAERCDSVAISQSNGDTFVVAALSSRTKQLLQFTVPFELVQEDAPTLLTATSAHPGHELAGGRVVSSSHGKWLASAAPDGRLVVRDIKDWDKVVAVTCHSFLEGGARELVFLPDVSAVATVGADDSSVAFFAWEFTSAGALAQSKAVEHVRGVNLHLRSGMEEEEAALAKMEEWSPEPARGASPEPDPSQAAGVDDEQINADTLVDASGRPASNTRSSVTMTPTPTPAADSTWLDTRLVLALKAENSQYDEEKRKLRKSIRELRKTILVLMETNATLPELERLRQDEYNLDTEEQKRMRAEQEKSVQEVREEIHLENLSQRYLAYLIKKECWDDMVTKGRGLKGFNATTAVSNYPMRAITAAETRLLKRVTRMREIEIASNKVRKDVVEVAANKSNNAEDEEEEDAGAGGELLSLHGSLGPKYGGGSDLFYTQFELNTRESKIAQVVLVKDAIRRVKSAFNDAFSGVHKNKDQEIARIKERNVRIREIMKELDMDPQAVFDPEMDADEMPEKSFVVADHEVTVERVLSEEQQKAKEEKEKMEEERRAAEKGDNKRERALNDMMGGVIEVKKEDILKQDLPPPDFVNEKLEKDWTDEEKKKLKEFEKKLKELQVEREKYRKNLETELKKLQQSNADGMAQFDDSLLQLFNRKIKSEMVIHQEELKILRMTSGVVMDDELCTQEDQLNYLLQMKNDIVESSATALEEVRQRVDEYREVYDSITAEDKMLDRGFKRDFADVPLSVSELLYKLFKRRPRLQRQRTFAGPRDTDPYGLEVGDLTGASQLPAAHVDAEAMMAELDTEANIPEGVDAPLWERLCSARHVKVESEQRVKHSANTLAQMTQYLQNRQDESDSLNRQLEEIIKQQIKLCEDRMRCSLNLDVQFLLKQGQVEVTCGPYIPDFGDSILIQRSVVEDLNGTIKTLGESKVAAMTESKDFKKGIHQLEWDRKRMVMQMEDLHNRARHIQMLKLTKDLQAFLNEEDQSSKQAKQMAALEQSLAMQEKQQDKLVARNQNIAYELERTIHLKMRENQELDEVLEELFVSVSERTNINDVNAAERAKNTASRRLKGIVQRRKLVDLAKAQAQEVAVLRAEVERLRMKTFPALVQVER